MPTNQPIRSNNFGVFFRLPAVHLRDRIRNIEHIDLARSFLSEYSLDQIVGIDRMLISIDRDYLH